MLTKQQFPEYTIISLLITVFVLLVLAIVIVVITFIFKNKQNKLIVEKRQMQVTYEQSLLRTQLEIQEQTLNTISQEIHDNIGQVLSLAKLHLNTLINLPDAVTQQKADTTKQLVSKAINDLRDLSRSLHGDKIAAIGIEEAIEGQLKIIQNSGQFTTALTVTGEPVHLQPQQEMVLFRMVQEILNNAVKHSKAKNIAVVLTYTAASATLTITDDGIGFDTATLNASKTGIGLSSLYQRAAIIQAVIQVQSAPGKGTVITIVLPHT
jgi:two-component system, NarL family, sensor kinase